jgi:sporulation protein YlmC with PRC-barrel domain
MASLDDPTNPSGHLIAARQVQHAKVYNTALEDLGTIDDVMIDKKSGRIAYAILNTGGFLGIGETHYPLPWEKLRYDTEMGGYILDVERSVLEGGPSYTDRSAANWHDEAWARNIYAYYGVPPFWDGMP